MSDTRSSFGLVFVEAGGTGSGSGSGNSATATGGPLGTTTGPPPLWGTGDVATEIGWPFPSTLVACHTAPVHPAHVPVSISRNASAPRWRKAVPVICGTVPHP
jgi:hypothetical protein